MEREGKQILDSNDDKAGVTLLSGSMSTSITVEFVLNADDEVCLWNL